MRAREPGRRAHGRRDAAWEWAKAQPQASQAGGQAQAEAGWADSGLALGETACARIAGNSSPTNGVCRTADQMACAFGLHRNELSKYLGKLSRTGQVGTRNERGDTYYVAQRKEKRHANV